MKRVIKITVLRLIVAILCFMLAGYSINSIFSFPVQASGTTTVEIGACEDTEFDYTGTWNYPWIYSCLHCERIAGGGGRCGWYDTTVSGDDRNWPNTSAIRFDLSTVPDDAEYISATIKLFCTAKFDNNPLYDDFFWNYYKTNPGGDMVWDVLDADNWYLMKNQGYGRMAAPQHYTAVTEDEWYEVDILDWNLEQALERYNDTDYIYFQLMPENQGLMYSPTYSGDNKYIYFDTNGFANFKIEITYISQADDREPVLHVNAAVNTTALGTEIADNITLETLRCMYADETMSYLVNGESGANISMQLIDTGGTVLDAHTDSVRVDGIYSWQIDTPSSYSGFVRVHEIINNLWSEYVCIRPSPASTQATNRVYSGLTNYPQYTEPFSSYVVDDGGLMYIHWKSNIDGDTELADFNLKLYSNGSTNTPLYNKTLLQMADEYYHGSEANSKALLHWRYAVFTPALLEGTSNYGGIVQDLYMSESKSFRRGFIQPILFDNTDNTTFAETHSAYWYLSSPAKGISMNMKQSEYTEDDTPVVNLNIGNECKVETNLNYGIIDVSDGGNYTFIAGLGQQDLTIGQQNDGIKTISVKLSNPGYHTYEYRYDMTVTIHESGTEGVGTGVDDNSPAGFLEKIMSFFTSHGYDNPIGHWLIILAGMLFTFLICYQSPVMRVAMPLVVLAAGFVGGWIDRWIVILFALGAGLTIWGFTRKKMAGGSGEAEG